MIERWQVPCDGCFRIVNRKDARIWKQVDTRTGELQTLILCEECEDKMLAQNSDTHRRWWQPKIEV